MNIVKLQSVTKPARYLGNEINTVYKDIKGKLHICLAFPDIYEVGMSHLGMKILYESLNKTDDIYAERFFMPWPDAIEGSAGNMFVSLETKTPLADFDILGFSVQYELSYSNILAGLHYSNIPLKSSERTEEAIIAAGGPCVFNPKPLQDFIDVFFMGEMDSAFSEVCSELHKAAPETRNEKLKFLNRYSFTYVPSIEPGKTVKRKIYTNFSTDDPLSAPIVPSIPVIQDRVVSEIARGCSRGCRFCQAGFVYRPVRERNTDDIIKNILKQLENTGYENVSLLSLSAADYSCLQNLLIDLAGILTEGHVSLSLPSLRADKVDGYMFEELARVRKSGFTIAPEAGSQRMRNIINKQLSEEEIVDAVTAAADNGWKSAKLYFMIGLPFERDEDVIAIAALSEKIKLSLKGKKGFDISISVSNFVPKSFTPFQWYPQDTIEELKRKQGLLKNRLKNLRLKFSFHDVYQSVLEGAFARGDETLNDIIREGVLKGALFDGWSEFFDYEIWKKSFALYETNIEDYSNKSFSFDTPLPWSCISTGVNEKFLSAEYRKSSHEAVTDDCRYNGKIVCKSCGVCDFDRVKNKWALTNGGPFDISENHDGEDDLRTSENYVLNFSKTGKAVLYSAIETSRVFAHALRISNSKLVYSRGFNPQPKISYIYPLPVGVEGLNEKFLLKTYDKNINKIIDKMNEVIADGFYIKSAERIESKISDEMVGVYYFDEMTYGVILDYLNKDKAVYEKKTKKGRVKNINLRDYLIDNFDDKCIIFVNINSSGGFNFLEFFKFINYNKYNKVVREHIFQKKELTYV